MLAKWILFCLSIVTLSAGEIDLTSHEASLYSQNGEDGILAYLLQKIGPSSRYFVELGASDGITHSNTYLLLLQGWDGLSLDRSFDIPAYNLHKEFITKENINALLGKYRVPDPFDVLSIRTAYNAFHIWKGISYQPAIVLISVNSLYPPDLDRVVLYHPYFIGDHTNYCGASLLSLYKLGRAKGYSLVYAESSGHTLFFVRDDLLESKNLSFKDMNDVKALYRPAAYTLPADPLDRPFTTADEILNR